jgi:hypothetical protein
MFANTLDLQVDKPAYGLHNLGALLDLCQRNAAYTYRSNLIAHKKYHHRPPS